jgi:hypothetical protein
VDNGFRAAILTTTFTHLYSHHPGCDGVTDRCGMSCKCAIHRECGSRGCYSSGFGPVEYSGDDAYMTCVAAADVVGVSFAELSTHHGGCNGPSASGTGACNAAISRYCASRGYVSGFGPVEQSATDAWVTCVRAAAKVGTTYTELSTHHGGCNGTTETVGCACNAAIKRFCVSRGYTSGFGPTEMSGDYAEVVCVFP